MIKLLLGIFTALHFPTISTPYKDSDSNRNYYRYWIVTPKIKPGKPPRVPKKIKLPTFKTSLPRGSRVAVNIRIAGKIFAIKKPINIALQRATTIVLRDKKIKKFDLIIVGVTKAKDKLRPKALDKFKGTKGDRVYTYVQK